MTKSSTCSAATTVSRFCRAWGLGVRFQRDRVERQLPSGLESLFARATLPELEVDLVEFVVAVNGAPDDSSPTFCCALFEA